MIADVPFPAIMKDMNVIYFLTYIYFGSNFSFSSITILFEKVWWMYEKA